MGIYKFLAFITISFFLLIGCDNEYNTINEDANLKKKSENLDLAARSDKIHPVAKIKNLETNVTLNELIFVDGVSSYDSDGWIKEYSWSLNDKEVSNSSTHAFKFDQLGKHTICLTVTDNDNLKATTCKNIIVSSLTPSNEKKSPPVAKFSISTSDLELHPYIPYTLDCSNSYDTDENNQTIISCDWSQSDAYWYYGYDKIIDPPNCAKITTINKTQALLEICDSAAKVEIVLVVTDNEGDTNKTSKMYYIKDWY